jgi:hypothetical protein
VNKNLLRLLLPLILLSLLGVGCGPAYRYRPAQIMPKGAVELGAGGGLAADTRNNSFGGFELQTWIRGGVDDRVEIGARFWTYTLISAAGAFDLRIQVARGPVDISLDGSVVAGVCCELGEDQNLLAGALGFDTGFSIGKRLGGERGPAIYFAPHFQMSWTLPREKYWPMLLSLPLGLDIPLGNAPLALRPEFVVVGEIYRNGDQAWRVGGGIGLAVQPPSPKKLRAQREAARRARDEAQLKELEAQRKRYGLDPKKGAPPEKAAP